MSWEGRAMPRVRRLDATASPHSFSGLASFLPFPAPFFLGFPILSRVIVLLFYFPHTPPDLAPPRFALTSSRPPTLPRLSSAPRQTPFVWVLPVSDTALAGRVFGKVPLAGSADVADVAKRTCEEYPRWGVDAGQVKLFAVTKAGKAPTSAEIEAALLLEPLSPFVTLADAGIVSGSCVLARVPPPPAAAPGASRRRAGDPPRALTHVPPPPLSLQRPF